MNFLRHFSGSELGVVLRDDAVCRRRVGVHVGVVSEADVSAVGAFIRARRLLRVVVAPRGVRCVVAGVQAPDVFVSVVTPAVLPHQAEADEHDGANDGGHDANDGLCAVQLPRRLLAAHQLRLEVEEPLTAARCGAGEDAEIVAQSVALDRRNTQLCNGRRAWDIKHARTLAFPEHRQVIQHPVGKAQTGNFFLGAVQCDRGAELLDLHHRRFN